MKDYEYVVLRSRSSDDLAAQVVDHRLRGFGLVGGVSECDDGFAQAMERDNRRESRFPPAGGT